MDNVQCCLPRGVIDKIGLKAVTQKNIEAVILQTLSERGYQLILPASIEFEDIIALGIGDNLIGSSFRFDDWETGRMLVIPPDITPQIARISSTRLKNISYPHRLSYSGSVLRHSERQSGRGREIYQAGAEIIGGASINYDIEILLIVVKLAEKLGLENFTINIGHMGICQGVLNECCVSLSDYNNLKKAIALKDKTIIRSIVDSINISDAIANQLMALTRMFGGIEILDFALAHHWNDQTQKALENLKAILNALSNAGVDVERYCNFDLGDIRGLGYHTGITFEGFTQNSGDALFSGGRYDTLMSKYGAAMPATGFTCDVTGVATILSFKDRGVLCSTDLALMGNLSTNHSLADEVRRSGLSVVVEPSDWPYSEAIKYAHEHNISFILYPIDLQKCVLKCLLANQDDEWLFCVPILDCCEIVNIVFNSKESHLYG